MPDGGHKAKIPCPGHDGRGCSLGRGVSYGCTICNGEGHIFVAAQKAGSRRYATMTTSQMMWEVSRRIPEGGVTWFGSVFVVSDDVDYDHITKTWSGFGIDEALRMALEDTDAV